MKRNCLIICLWALCATLRAVPAKRVVCSLTQPDGTLLSAMPWGDDRCHGLATLDGLPLLPTTDGGWAYALVENGCLSPTLLLAHDVAQRNEEETAFVQANGEEILSAVAQLCAERTAQVNARRLARRRKGSSQQASSYTGTKRGIVILVNFSDRSMVLSNPQTTFDAQFNTEGYTQNNHIGSVHDYFYDQSYGEFDLQFDVVGPYTLSNTLAYYGTNDTWGDDQYVGQMIGEACLLADDDVDFSQYDWDGDGTVDQVFIIYAGYGENAGASSTTVWPCEWDLASSDYGSTLTLDGVIVNTFACCCELAGTSGSTINGIGIACHEFSHCLGLPDLYDTSGGSNFGMSTWSIMDSGTYNGPSGNGEVPCAYTGYERMYAGWLTPVTLSGATVVSDMKPITAGDPADVYILYNDNCADEYYILENHQQVSWDAYAYGHGMLVIHVDYDEDRWQANTVNNTASHQRCTIIPADNKLVVSTSSLAADPYPGTSANTSLTDDSTPAATLYNANSNGTYYLSKPITDITESDGNISFALNGAIDTPVAIDPTNISATSFTANWESVSGATYYNVRLYAVASEQATLVCYEDFSGLSSTTSASFAFDSKLDQYIDNTGWTGYKLFTGYYRGEFHGLKIGSEKYAGYLLSPLYDTPANLSVTVYVVCEAYTTDKALSLTISILDEDGATLADTTVTADGSYILSTDVTTPYRAKFATDDTYHRAWINELAIADGNCTAQDIEEWIADNTGSSPRRATTLAESVSVSDTSYTFSDLDSSCRYYYTVQAVTGDYTSDWSNTVYVTLDATAIETISADNTPLGDDTPVRLYTPSGTLLRTTTLGHWSDALPRGIYLLSTPTQTLKVVCPSP